MTGRQNLEFFAKLRNLWDCKDRIEYLLKLFQLKEKENNLVMHYSTGMKHKLAFAIALLNDPPILLLDEPLTGIDPLTAHGIKKVIKEEFKEKTIIWTSHNLYEIEEMCDRIGILNKGRLILEGSPDELKKKYWNYEKVRVITSNPQPFLKIEGSEIIENGIEIKTNDVISTIQEVMEICRNKNIKIEDITVVKPTLEDIFVSGVKNAE